MLQRFPAAGQQFWQLAHGHQGQAPEDIGEIFLRVDAEAAATLNDGVDDGGAPSRIRMPDEEPSLLPDGRRAYVVFTPVMPPPGLCRVAA